MASETKQKGIVLDHSSELAKSQSAKLVTNKLLTSKMTRKTICTEQHLGACQVAAHD